jgi:hypothetical protein
MATSKRDQILRLFKGMEIVRPRDAEAIGIALQVPVLMPFTTRGFSNDLESQLKPLFRVM